MKVTCSIVAAVALITTEALALLWLLSDRRHTENLTGRPIADRGGR